MAAEKQFEDKVKKFLKEEGCYFIKTHGDRFAKKGTPDLLVCCNGFFIGVELKAENGKPSELQLHHVEQIKKSGGIAQILYPKEFENFKKLIRFLKNRTTIGKDVIYYSNIVENHLK